MSSRRAGFELPLLLLGAFRSSIDDLHAQLAQLGHPEARPLHGFALQAVGPDGASVSELGRRLGVSKQAAAKTAAALERAGYIVREADPSDARAVRLRRSAHGEQMLAFSAEILSAQRDRWAAELGAERVTALEDDLERLAGPGGGAGRIADVPGWIG